MARKDYIPLKSSGPLQRLMKRYYLLTRYHHLWGRPLRRPLAWITSGAPVEILQAFGIDSLYPENYGAIYGARRKGGALALAAETKGFSPDLCSYARANLGAIYHPDLEPLGGLPRPDLLVISSNICGTVLKWYEALARHYGVPLLIVDTPFVAADDGVSRQHAVAYVRGQLRQLIADLTKISGRPLSMSELERRIKWSNEAVQLWEEIRRLGRNRPAPLNVPDLFIQMAPIVVLRGTPQAVAYYRQLYAEAQERVRQGLGAVPGEKYRLLWDNIAIWHHLYRFFNLFSRRGAAFVVDTYTAGWAGTMAPGDPLESLARTYTEVFLNQSFEFRVRQMIQLIREYRVDGFVMHSNRSCKPYSLIQEEMRRRVMAETGVPGLIVEADMTDERAYAEEPIKNRVEAFLESLEGGGD